MRSFLLDSVPFSRIQVPREDFLIFFILDGLPQFFCYLEIFLRFSLISLLRHKPLPGLPGQKPDQSLASLLDYFLLFPDISGHVQQHYGDEQGLHKRETIASVRAEREQQFRPAVSDKESCWQPSISSSSELVRLDYSIRSQTL